MARELCPCLPRSFHGGVSHAPTMPNADSFVAVAAKADGATAYSQHFQRSHSCTPAGVALAGFCWAAVYRKRRDVHAQLRRWARSIRSTSQPANGRGVLRAAESLVTSEEPGRLDQAWARYKFLYVAVCLHLLGFTMSGPILPGLRTHFSLMPAQTGLISSAFPLGMLLAVSIFPAFSDKVGRVPVMLISYTGVGLGFVMQALSVQCGAPFQVFLGLRIATGTFAGASTVVKALLADVANQEGTGTWLPALMAWREAAGTLAFVFGPAMSGALLTALPLPYVLMISGSTSLLAALLVLGYVKAPAPSGSPIQKETSAPTASTSEQSPDSTAGRQRWIVIGGVMLSSFAYNIGQAFFDSFFAVLVSERFSLAPSGIGRLLSGLAVLVFIVASRIYAPLAQAAGIVSVGTVGLLLMAGSMLLLGSATSVSTVILALTLYGIGLPLFTPSVPIVLAGVAPKKSIGLILGIDSAVNTLGRVLAPAVMGLVYQGKGASAAFSRAGIIVAAGAGIFVTLQSLLRRVRSSTA